MQHRDVIIAFTGYKLRLGPTVWRMLHFQCILGHQVEAMICTPPESSADKFRGFEGGDVLSHNVLGNVGRGGITFPYIVRRLLGREGGHHPSSGFMPTLDSPVWFTIYTFMSCVLAMLVFPVLYLLIRLYNRWGDGK